MSDGEEAKMQVEMNTPDCSCPENICVLEGQSVNQIAQPGNAKNHKFDARNYFESQKFALQGIRLIIVNERNFRTQLVVAVIAVIGGLLLQITHQDWVALFVVIALVLVAEAFNSVVEAICDTISRDYRINIKYAKDVSAGAVFVSAAVSLLAGIIIFSPYLWNFLEKLLQVA